MGNTTISVDSSKTSVDHVTVRIALAYDRLVKAFESELGRFDPVVAQSLVERRASWNEAKQTIARMAGPHGLMIIAVADQGVVTSLSGKAKRCVLYTVGNPVIANDIIDIDPAASFYVPFRIALYETGDRTGAVIAYDRPSSFLAASGRPELKPFGALLDQKVDAVITAVTRAN
jgi:uncharacterized protein (DUF302 family)